jgi:hypothetical protein
VNGIAHDVPCSCNENLQVLFGLHLAKKPQSTKQARFSSIQMHGSNVSAAVSCVDWATSGEHLDEGYKAEVVSTGVRENEVVPAGGEADAAQHSAKGDCIPSGEAGGG